MGKTTRYTAFYARQSVSKDDSVSIETQFAECQRQCKSKYVKKYSDRGFSGKSFDRPEVENLIRDIKSDKIETVICYRLDRISRNISDFYNLYEVMKEHDCKFISATESFDTSSPMGRAMMSILITFAQMERESIQERIISNIQFRLTDNRWVSGKAPYGFTNGKDSDGKTTLVPVPDEIKVVKFLYKTYSDDTNCSLGQLQSRLIKEGYSGHQSMKGFARTTLSRILSNPIYASADSNMMYLLQKKGVALINNNPEAWDGSFACAIVGKGNRSFTDDDLSGASAYLTNVKPVISSREYIMVHNRLKENTAVASSNVPTNRLGELSGLIKCAECGSAVKMESKTTFVCVGRNQKRICDVSFAGVRLAKVREQVDNQIDDYLSHLSEVSEAYKLKRRKTIKEIDELSKKIDRLTDLIVDTDDDNLIANTKKHIYKYSSELNDKKLSLNTENPDDVIQIRLNAGMPDISSIDYKILDTERKQMILRTLVDKILLYHDGVAVVKFKE